MPQLKIINKYGYASHDPIIRKQIYQYNCKTIQKIVLRYNLKNKISSSPYIYLISVDIFAPFLKLLIILISKYLQSPLIITSMSKTPSRDKDPTDDSRKVFITNIDGAHHEQTVEIELRRLFERFGNVTKLNVKKNKNGLYSFAFLEFDSGQSASASIKELDQYELFGKRMRVYFRNRSRRQDRQSEGCFHCKRPGHFAKECPENRDNRHEPREYHQRREYREDREERYDRRGGDHRRDRQRYDDRYRPHYREGYDRRDRDYQYRRRRTPSRSRSHSRSYRRRDYSSQSEHRYGHSRRYYDHPRDRSGRREEPLRRRRDSSFSRSRSSGR